MDYFELRTSHGVSYLRYNSVEKLAEVGGIIFDCDGVLIDATPSYDAAIRYTVAELVKVLTGLQVAPEHIPTNTIYAVRAVGGFNNDCDTVHLLTVWLLAHAPPQALARLAELGLADKVDPYTLYTGLARETEKIAVDEKEIGALCAELESEVEPLAGTGLTFSQVEEKVVLPVAEKTGGAKFMELVRALLGYPGGYGESLLLTLFEESFFGSDNIRQVRPRGPFFSLRGKVEDERLLVNEETLMELRRSVGGLGMATGRGAWETFRTLGKLSEHFERKACIFVADVIADKMDVKDEYEKPKPYSLIEAGKNLGVNGSLLYVGDSAEDLIMWVNACKMENRYLFAGVYGGARDLERLEQFMEGGSDIIIPNIEVLPKILAYTRT